MLYLLTTVPVNNDFYQAHGIFPVFDGLAVSHMDAPYNVSYTNGTNGVNGHSAFAANSPTATS